jgi:RNA-directed DNA polymerase
MERLANDLGLPLRVVIKAANVAPRRYKVYQVPKRSGSGLRTIAQPSKITKYLQRWLLAEELQHLPIHGCATAYREGASIRENAFRHVANRYLLKVDFRNFFPSIKESDLVLHFKEHRPEIYSEEELKFMCHVLLWRPKPRALEMELCIGAPSSPCISNTILFSLDCAISNYCEERKIVYTRYADDLAFSTNEPHQLEHIPGFLRKELKNLSWPKLRLNEAKTVFTSKKFRRTVTGLVLSSQGVVSLGRDRKRLIRAMVHKFEMGLLEESALSKLRGLLSFAMDAEPDFVARLERSVGRELVETIRRRP